jgi:putative copper resistance protein D
LTEGDAPLVIARWLHFVSLSIAFGASLFPFYAMPGKLASSFPIAGRTERLIKFCAYLALASGVLWVADVIAEIGDGPIGLVDPATLSGFLFETDFGPTWIVKLALLLGFAVCVTIPARGTHATIRHSLIAALAAGALSSQAWLGHAAMANGGKFGMELAAYIVHVLAAAAWIGALVPLALLSSRPAYACPKAIAAYCEILTRFSKVGVGLVLAILATAVANAAYRLASLTELTTTLYGLVILAKAALFLAMLAIAAANRWLFLPNVPQTGPHAIAVLRRTIISEQALAALVLLAAAILGILAP